MSAPKVADKASKRQGPIDAAPAFAHGRYFIGDSMSPAYEQGDLLIVYPGRPVRPGDDCVFVRDQGDGTQQFMVKRLLRITAKKWRVRQYSPAKDFDLDRSQWQKVELIVGKQSR